MELRIAHVVVTANFAGVERYVATTAAELADRGCDVVVVGGKPGPMRRSLAGKARWLPGATATEALRSLRDVGRRDLCHAHMTLAEALLLVARPMHRAPVISTRHFAAHRGSAALFRAWAPVIAAGLAREIAASAFVGRSLERPPDAVIRNGVPPSPLLWRRENRVVLVAQRLEAEKETLTALRAWEQAGLWEEGWSLRVLGDGSQRLDLTSWVRERKLPGVTFAGWAPDVKRHLADAGMMLAPAPAEPFGLGVVEAMAAGVPVIASAAGGHLETVGALAGARLFAAYDSEGAALQMRDLLDATLRAELSTNGRELVEAEFSLGRHVDRLLEEYERVGTARHAARRVRRRSSDGHSIREVVVCSLEPWDEIWRRNQFLVDRLLERSRELRVLFVEPPVDPLLDLSRRRRPALPGIRTVDYDGRLHILRPLKPLPRKLGTTADAFLRLQVRGAARAIGFSTPTLWVNDVTYAPLIRSAHWPAVYDVTDDWLAAPFARQELRRLERLERVALENAAAVTVCSPALARSRGQTRPVALIPNAVDVDHLRRPRPRPKDLPSAPVLVYVGTLHEARLDIELLVTLARSIPSVTIALIGPDALSDAARNVLHAEPNVWLGGARSYKDVPAYLQHADVLIVPHVVNAFTDSLDPIKAYECLAVGVPTVATPVAGFRELDGAVSVAPRERFGVAVQETLAAKLRRTHVAVPTWDERAAAFDRVLAKATSER